MSAPTCRRFRRSRLQTSVASIQATPSPIPRSCVSRRTVSAARDRAVRRSVCNLRASVRRSPSICWSRRHATSARSRTAAGTGVPSHCDAVSSRTGNAAVIRSRTPTVANAAWMRLRQRVRSFVSVVARPRRLASRFHVRRPARGPPATPAGPRASTAPASSPACAHPAGPSSGAAPAATPRCSTNPPRRSSPPPPRATGGARTRRVPPHSSCAPAPSPPARSGASPSASTRRSRSRSPAGITRCSIGSPQPRRERHSPFSRTQFHRDEQRPVGHSRLVACGGSWCAW